MIPRHPLCASTVEVATPGDFGITIKEDGTASIPKNILTVCREAGFRNIEELISFAWCFPVALRYLLSWDEGLCEEALEKAVRQLTGLVDDAHLRKPNPTPGPLGAYSPSAEQALIPEDLR